MIVRFSGMYHGGTDFVLGGVASSEGDRHAANRWNEGDSYSKACYTTGRAAHALNDVYLIEFNDLEQMEALFQSDDDIACVIIEPVCMNISGCMPEPGYLEGVRRLCDQYGVLGDDRYCVSLAHTEEDVQRSIEIADYVLKILKEDLHGWVPPHKDNNQITV